MLRNNSGAARQTADGSHDAETGRVTRAAGLLGALTLVSRIAGLARDVVISAVFGTSTGADAFFIAFRIPNLFRRIVGEGATSAAFVPVFTSTLESEGKAGALRAASAVGGLAFLALVAIVGVGMFASDPIVALFAPGYAADPAKRELTVELTRWTFPYLLFVGAAAWAMGVLHTFRNFAAPAYGPILLNASIITASLALAGVFSEPAYALVVGVLIGGLLQFLVQLPALARLGFRPSGLFAVAHPAVRRVGVLLATVVFGAGVYQVNILVATLFASLLPAGSVSYLWYADRVFEFPLGIVAVAVGTAALPGMSAQAQQGRLDAMAETVVHSVRLTWALCIPAAVGLFVLAPEIVALLFERGRFSSTDTASTAWALRAYVPGLLGVGAVRVLASSFYALHKPRIPVYAALVALACNAFFDLALMGPTDPTAPWWGAGIVATLGDAVRLADMRHAGLALSTGIAATANAAVLFALLGRELPSIGFSRLFEFVARHGAAAAVMGGAVVGWQQLTDVGLVFEVTGALVVGAVTYAGAGWVLGSVEIRELFRAVASRLRTR